MVDENVTQYKQIQRNLNQKCGLKLPKNLIPLAC